MTTITASSVFDQLRKDNKLADYGIQDYQPIYAKLELLKEKHPLIKGCISEGYG
jgi:hypothetical protein